MTAAESRIVTSLNGVWDFKSDAPGEVWRKIPVPGCYSEYRSGKWRKDYWDAFGYPHEWTERGATYRRTITISKSQLERPLAFRCDGCYHVYRILLNDTEVGSSSDGHTPTICYLNDAAKEGDNVLKVVVDEGRGELKGGESVASRGIWQDTSLISHGARHIEGTPHIITSVSNETLRCAVQLKNRAPDQAVCSVALIVRDADGRIVQESEQQPTILPGNKTTSTEIVFTWPDARLWYPHDPYLYTLQILLLDEHGHVIDHWDDRFGFREITVDGPHLYLNGQELYLRGHGGHYLGDLQGTKEYHLTWLSELKKIGVNFLRLHIYPKHRTLYEAADELGIMLMGEPAFHFSVPEETEELIEFSKQHLGDMIDHLRNHPSIIMWSVSNEFRWNGGGEKPWLVDHARHKDPTRPAFSSDFSAFSTYGDLIGHHYNTDTVFDEWEEHGADKPMIWDECGEVWHPTRPLGNGSAGYETACQDYATGTFRDGSEEILRAMDLIREGRSFSGDNHRINGVIPWDLGYVFFRWQPYNRFRGIALRDAHEGESGVRPQQVLPFSSPLNIWDPSLPVYEPNPAFYLFDEDLKTVRFSGESKSRTYFSGRDITATTPLLIYDDLRPADSVHCRIESEDGTVLTEVTKQIECSPGQMYRDISWTFKAPVVDAAKKIRLVRIFSKNGQPGHRDERTAFLYPALSPSDVDETNTIWIHDPSGSITPTLRKLLGPIEVAATIEEIGSSARVLITTGTDISPRLLERIRNGLRVVQLSPHNPEGESIHSAVKPLNGPPHRLLDHIPQEALTFWRGGSTHSGLPRNLDAINSRTVLAADRDCRTSALEEKYIGAGILIQTTLRIADSLENEPASHAVLRNLIRRASAYETPKRPKNAACVGSDSWQAWLRGTGLVAEYASDLNEVSPGDADVVLIEASYAVGRESELAQLASAGITTFIQGVNENSIESIVAATGLKLTLTKPFLDERTLCVKSATCWTLRDTPKDGLEYFENTVIPQPFEPKYDPLLSGLCNIDLRSPNGKPIFDQGIKPEGFDPVGYNKHAKMLVSNWRIDWSVPPAGGEYISVGKDIRRAQWFLNRDPALLRVNANTGTHVLCQLNLMEMADNGVRVMRQLLTNMGCSLGNPTYIPTDESTFDMTKADEQKIRLLSTKAQIATMPPLPELPEIFNEISGEGGDGEQRRVLLLLDQSLKRIGGSIVDKIGNFATTSIGVADYSDIEGLIEGLERDVSSSKWDIIYFTTGNIPANSETETMHLLLRSLKERGTQLMWGSSLPVSPASGDQTENNRVRKYIDSNKEAMKDIGAYVNDSYEYCFSNFGDYVWGDASDLGDSRGNNLAASIAEAIKFFGV